MSEDKSKDMFPASARLAIGGTDLKGTNTIEMYKESLIRYGKQSFGMYACVFQEGKIREEYINYFKPSEVQKAAAKDDKFIEKDLFNLIDSSKKDVDDFRMIRPKMTAFELRRLFVFIRPSIIRQTKPCRLYLCHHLLSTSRLLRLICRIVCMVFDFFCAKINQIFNQI